MLTYPWKCTVLHCNHLGNTWKPLVLMTRHFDYCPSASEGDNQSVRSSAPVVSRCFPGGYNVKLYISRGRLAWWLLAFLHSVMFTAAWCQPSTITCESAAGTSTKNWCVFKGDLLTYFVLYTPLHNYIVLRLNQVGLLVLNWQSQAFVRHPSFMSVSFTHARICQDGMSHPSWSLYSNTVSV